jgi:hypothetical protein
MTTVDTAESLPDWSIFGVDCSFARYVLFDVLVENIKKRTEEARN